MTTHLSSQEFVSALDLALEPARQAHLDRCASCQAQVQELREMVDDAADGAVVPEPSPLFWDHFQARVLAAVETESAEAVRQGWWQVWAPARTWITTGATAAAVIAAVAFYVGRPSAPVSDTMAEAPGIEGAASTAVLGGDEWEFVAGMMGALEDDDVHEVLIPTHDALDAAFEGLSSAERDRFVQLLKAELTEGLE